jgi:uncharacterized membrane protein YedE/YeeE
MNQAILLALIGGVFIGAATAIFLIFNGRVTGISGILNTFLNFKFGERLWRGAFLAGLILGGFMLRQISPNFFVNTTLKSPIVLIIAGLLVGYGTVLGSGCTSGHGICGVARLSVRSVVATIVFIGAGMITATVFKYMAGL